MSKKVIIDTDIGDDIDDALALALAINSPEIEILGVTTVYGQVKTRAKLVAKILEEYGLQHIPVVPGFSKPILNPEPKHVPNQAKVLKDKEVFNNILDTKVVSFYEDIIDSERKVYIITIGAMTNLAVFLLNNPEMKNKIEVISMAGSVYYPRVEYNVRCDPEAASIVFNSGVNLTLIPLDVTLRCRMNESIVSSFYTSKKHEVILLSHYLKYWQEHTHCIPILHDPLAVAVLIRESFVKTKSEKIHVELCGTKTKGLLIPGNGSSEIKVAYDVNVEDFMDFFKERVLE